MTRYLLDSNALSRFAHKLRGVRERALKEQRSGAVIGTAMPAAAETLAGVEYSESRDRNRPVIKRALNALRLWPFELPPAIEYARLYAEIRRNGDHVGAIDLMIAGVSRMQPDCMIVTDDTDFSRVPGVKIVDWTEK